MRVVFDTNVYVSMLITPGGRGEEAFLRAVDGECRLFTSVAILTETARVLVTKFAWERTRMEDAVRFIAQVASVVRPRKRVAVLEDEPDNRILECALAARAGVVVTGDRHLLVLGEFEGVRIVTLAGFNRMRVRRNDFIYEPERPIPHAEASQSLESAREFVERISATIAGPGRKR